jgi:hypothetical protein
MLTDRLWHIQDHRPGISDFADAIHSMNDFLKSTADNLGAGESALRLLISLLLGK